MTTKTWQIKEVAEQLRIHPQTLYYYERIGLLPPPQRTPGGYRQFTEVDIERLQFIQRAKALGFRLKEIRQLLDLREQRTFTCWAVYEQLQQKIAAIEVQMLELQALKQELETLLQECHSRLATGMTDQTCTLLEESAPSSP
ncbi:heavy metal-responsive transcriptional regulator [Thermosynechococcus sp.]|uniref:heavy metal-responsive transcriptional regulator n=1 Tax=Thermosynechococcus sp. TaxID=2814275 RepID=UPI00391D20AA